jgi:hypothetical protein
VPGSWSKGGAALYSTCHLTRRASTSVEEAYPQSKGALRKAGVRTCEALIDALGVAISAVTASDARCFVERGSYRLPVLLL